MKNTAKSLWASVLALVLCVSMLLGTTFAWFTDSVSSDRNTIAAGNLDVTLEYLKDGAFTTVGSDTKVFDPNIKWEPGYTSLTCLRVTNAGTLALQYLLSITVEAGTAILGENGENLADVIKVYTCYGENTAADYEEIETSVLWQYEGTLTEVMRKPNDFLGGQLLPAGETPDANALATTKEKEQVLTVALHMEETAGNEYQKLSVGDIYVNLVATQWNDEMDGFGAGYDADAIFPLAPGMLLYTSAPAVKDANGYLANALMLGADGDTGTASLPAGVKLADGADEVALQLSVIKNREAVVEMKGGDVAIPLDVHMVGVASDNDKPITVTLNGLFPKNYAQYNIRLFHVENGVTRAMTAVDSLADLDAHNEFYYDDATGTVTLAMATFSEVTAAVSAGNPWNGNAADISWYNTTDTEFTLMDADDFAGFAQIVGGMNGIARDDFAGKTVKLGADINMGSASSVNFAPVGYYYVADNGDGKPFSDVYAFSGTFDGQGYTISDVLQRTWDIKGDDPYYDLTQNHYYNDGMGIFGFVYNGTVKNLEVDNFQSDGEFSTTGCVAAYSAGVSTFENIRITNCNPRAYNVPNGGVVGYAYDEAEAAENAITFSNIIVDDSTKITALWGSWDVGCGGILGRMGNDTKVTMTNCSVAAEIDVYNDVCGNYQYYQYRYSGMLIGTCGSDSDPSDQIANVTFTDCHVRYGDWAEYYYCELVANSLASYTHDHQMSRLEKIDKLSEIKSGTTWLKAGNFLYDNNGTLECYHIVNDNGTLTQHLHEDEGYETVNDASVLVEDKQIVHIPFKQVYTGYGWGSSPSATGINVEDYIYSISYMYNGKVYGVTYVTDNNSAQSTANPELEALVLQYTPEGYEFSGWVTAASVKLSEVAAGNTANVTVYPSWNNIYTARWLDENGNVISEQEFTKDTTKLQDVAGPASSANYLTFDHWEIRNADGTSTDISNYKLSSAKGDITLYPYYNVVTDGSASLGLTGVDVDGDGKIDHYTVEAVDAANIGTKVEIPGSVNGIPVKVITDLSGGWASSVQNVVIKEGVEEIKKQAFGDTQNLETVELPSTITKIEDSAFAGNLSNIGGIIGYQKVLTIKYNGTKAEWDAVCENSKTSGQWEDGLAEGTTVICTDGTYTLTDKTYSYSNRQYVYTWTWADN